MKAAAVAILAALLARNREIDRVGKMCVYVRV
jgi:hypothetical protein